jgi:hypothetical protein
MSGPHGRQRRHAVSSGGWTQPPHHEWTNLGDSIKVAVDMHHTHGAVDSSFGNEQIWDGRTVPHPVMVREVLL